MTTTKTLPATPPKAADNNRIIVLGDPLLPADPALLGGKGASLHAMMRDGIPVPPAFCVPPEWDRSVPGAVDELLAARRALGCHQVAVRSSATTEDARSASSAGMHDTFLAVEDDDTLLDAIDACRSSLHSARADVYGVAGSTARMTVVVQEMVMAQSAGVCFTTHPVDPSLRGIFVEAAFGLGKAVVDGEVACDSYTLRDDGHVVERIVQEKTLMRCPAAGGGTRLAKVPEERRSQPALTDSHLAQIRAVVQRLRELEQTDIDVEFATDGDRVLFLQSRPVTTDLDHTPAASPYVTQVDDRLLKGTLWSRMDIGEIFTGTMTPLGLSFARYYQDNVHLDCAAALGVRDRGDVALQMGYLGGQVYLNISYSAQLLQQAPPTRNPLYFTQRFMSEEVDGASYRNPFGPYISDSRNVKETAYWVTSTLRELAVMNRRAKQMVASRYAETDRAMSIDLTALDRDGLHHEMRRHLDYFHDMHVGYMPYYINAFGLYGMLENLSTAWLDASGATGRVKSDMSALRTIETAREFALLARACEDYDGAARIVRELPPDEVMVALHQDPSGTRFIAEKLQPFLRENGVRGRQEMELTNPRWLDEPTYVVGVVARYLRNVEEREKVLARQPQRDTAPTTGSLTRRKRAVLAGLTKAYVRCSELRETTRMSMITSIWLVRRIVMELARRAVQDGHLRSIDEIAYVDFFDLLDLLAGRTTQEEAFAHPAIERRRHEHRRLARSPLPPLSIIGLLDEHDAREEPHDEAHLLRGLGTAAGTVTGRARVIRDVALQADELQADEILVAPFTDASWTPLFAVAAGVVTDVGSMLSHSSIVAREFGLVSVVNTRRATNAIRTGDLLRVDGTSGEVHVLARADDPQDDREKSPS